MSRKADYSKKILKTLAEKPALTISDIAQIGPGIAIKRSIRGLIEGGYVETHHSGQNEYARLTKEGKKRAHSIKLEGSTALVNPHWDRKWRIIMLDLPEERKDERDSLRYLLKKAGFVLLKNSVWISPYPFERLFMNIKKDLGLSTEIMIFVTDTLDTETEKEFLKLLK